jgi:hypothetical protein
MKLSEMLIMQSLVSGGTQQWWVDWRQGDIHGLFALLAESAALTR